MFHTKSSFPHTGFTIIELVVVIGLLTVLSTVLLSNLNPSEAQKKARDTKRMNDLKELSNTLEQYIIMDRQTPTGCLISNFGCDSSSNKYKCDDNWLQANLCQYLQKVPIDPINNQTRSVITGGTIDNPNFSDQTLRYKAKADGLNYEVAVLQESSVNSKNIFKDGGLNNGYAESGNYLAFFAEEPTPTLAPTLTPTLTPTPNPTVTPIPTNTPAPTPSSRYSFITSSTYQGNLGGLSGADTICQNLADNAGIGSTVGKSYKAWLSDSTKSPTTPSRLFVQSTVPYTRRNGTVIANNWTDLTDGSLANKLTYDEGGNVIGGSGEQVHVWTNTDRAGDIKYQNTNNNCDDWGTNNTSSSGAFGYSTYTNSNWTDYGGQIIRCDKYKHLYCFEQ